MLDFMYRYFIITAGSGCTAYDVVVSPEFMAKMNKSELFKTFFLTVMMEGLESKYDIEISRGNQRSKLADKKCSFTMKIDQ